MYATNSFCLFFSNRELVKHDHLAEAEYVGGGGRSAYGYELGANQLTDFEEIAVTRNAEEKGDRIANVANDELDGQRRIIDIEVAAPPGQKTVCQAQESDDAKESGENHARNLKSQPGAICEGM